MKQFLKETLTNKYFWVMEILMLSIVIIGGLMTR